MVKEWYQANLNDKRFSGHSDILFGYWIRVEFYYRQQKLNILKIEQCDIFILKEKRVVFVGEQG